ncbi:MAG: helix-turn-helix domain-containing protein [bacterium]|nr:helix-turn-helix domain-containing protein [bacterium]
MKKLSKGQKDIFKLIGKRVKEERELKGWSVEELAQKTGIRKEYIQKIEKGIAYGLAWSKYVKLTMSFKIPLSELVSEKL